jgi:cytochrome c oxidase cbb3-type subunit 3
MVGPNLTDDYWLHGGNIKSVFKTIKYGITAKGMPNWDKQLSPKQLSDVSNYIKTLHGTNPPNGKEPQGEKEEEEKLASN